MSESFIFDELTLPVKRARLDHSSRFYHHCGEFWWNFNFARKTAPHRLRHMNLTIQKFTRSLNETRMSPFCIDWRGYFTEFSILITSLHHRIPVAVIAMNANWFETKPSIVPSQTVRRHFAKWKSRMRCDSGRKWCHAYAIVITLWAAGDSIAEWSPLRGQAPFHPRELSPNSQVNAGCQSHNGNWKSTCDLSYFHRRRIRHKTESCWDCENADAHRQSERRRYESWRKQVATTKSQVRHCRVHIHPQPP